MAEHIGKTGKTVMAIVASAAVLFIGLAVIGASDPSTVTDRMKRECERAFPNELQERKNDCVIKLQIRWLAENHRDKMDAAYQRSR